MGLMITDTTPLDTGGDGVTDGIFFQKDDGDTNIDFYVQKNATTGQLTSTAAWDASRRILWGHSGDSGNGFIGFRPDGDNGDGTFGSWTPLHPKRIQTRADHNAMSIDPARDLIVVAVGAANGLYAIDPSAPDRAITRLSTTGDQPLLSEYAALEYAPHLDRFVYYSANDGPQIYSVAAPPGSSWAELTRGAWTWQSLLEKRNSLDPIADAQAISSYGVSRSHTFGRFRVATFEGMDVALLVRHTDTPVYAMRLGETGRLMDGV